MTTVQQAKMIIQYFNSKRGTMYKFGDTNVNTIVSLLETGYTDVQLKKVIIDYDGRNLLGCFDYANLPELKKTEPEPEAVNVVVTLEQAPAVAATSLNILEKAMAEIFTAHHAETIKNDIMAKAMENFKDFVKENYGELPRKQVTVLEVAGVKTETEETLHDKFEELVAFVSLDEPVMLTGPAGSGKNVLCKQVAKALNLDFYFTNAVTQSYQITGFTDAMGLFQESSFYKAFKNGGLFMLDELDASVPEVLVILNAAISNRYFDFPSPIGYLEAHKDFRIVAAGNTWGTGATYTYVGRNQLDGASLNRFGIITVGYNKKIEDSVAGGNLELANFCRNFRQAAEKAGQQVIVSYRDIGRIAKMEKVLPVDVALKTCLIKGMEKDDIKMIITNMNDNSKYRIEIQKMVS